MKDVELAQALKGLVAHHRHAAVVQEEGRQVLSSDELVINQGVRVELVAILEGEKRTCIYYLLTRHACACKQVLIT